MFILLSDDRNTLIRYYCEVESEILSLEHNLVQNTLYVCNVSTQSLSLVSSTCSLSIAEIS
jgi:hypothetical protein